MMQQGGAVPMTWVELIAASSIETRVVLVICLLFSLASWWVIGLQWWQLAVPVNRARTGAGRIGARRKS